MDLKTRPPVLVPASPMVPHRANAVRALVVLVLALVLSVVVPVQQANALTDGQKVKTVFSIAGKRAAGSAVTGSVAGPWGTAAGAVIGVGWALWDLDQAGIIDLSFGSEGPGEEWWQEDGNILDRIANLFPGAGADATAPTFSGGPTHDSFRYLPVQVTNAGTATQGIQVQWEYASPGTTYDQYWAVTTARLVCEHSTNGLYTQTQFKGLGSILNRSGYNQGSQDISCNSPGGMVRSVTLTVPSAAEWNRTNLSEYAIPGSKTWRDPSWTPTGAPMITTEMQCVDAEGTVHTVTESVPKSESRAVIPSCKELGYVNGVGTKVSETVDGQQVGPPLFESTPGGDQMTNCDPMLGRICHLEVEVDGAACQYGVSGCEDWARIAQSSPERVQCLYGGQVIHISGCNSLEGGYRPGGTPAVAENMDGNPDTWLDPATVPGAWPAKQTSTGIVQDPDWEPGMEWPSQYPSSEPSTGTDTGAEPGTGSGTMSDAPATGQHPSGDSCLAGAWSWNPIDWVFVPVKCALSWAFVPDTAKLQGHGTRLKTEIEAKGIGAIVDDMDSSVASIPGGGSGCMGPPLHFKVWKVDDTFYPLNACDEPVATVAKMTSAFIGLVVTVGGGLAIIRNVAAGFGYNFRMRPATDEELTA